MFSSEYLWEKNSLKSFTVYGFCRPDCGLQRIDHIVGNQPDLEMTNITDWLVSPSMILYTRFLTAAVWPHRGIRRCVTQRHSIWSKTVSSSQTLVDADCGPRSADVDTCIVPLARTRLGDRSFSVAGPRPWNSLPAELRQPDVEIGQFRRLLKTFCLRETAVHNDFFCL